ncbi:MAG: glucose-6-phosphate isomerase [Planctomycetota bacterium]|nr:glucose-6-phosphate isomerase [Planctomycetota bacterium]
MLKYDFSNALNAGQYGIEQSDIDDLTGALEDSRAEILDVDIPMFENGTQIPEEKKPLDTAFIDFPRQLLDEYAAEKDQSELGQILTCGRDIRSRVDRAVVLGIGGSYMGARALMDSCCEPYFNELPKSLRGDRPRIYFEGNNVDNDATRGLLRLLNAPSDAPCDDWAIVVISKSGGTTETAVAFRQFLNAFQQSVGKDKTADLVIPVTGTSGKLFELSNALGCKHRFRVPDGIGGRFSVTCAVGLVPAAIMGLDLVSFLQGAVDMTRHFKEQPVNSNVVMDYVAVNHLLEKKGMDIRLLSVWSKALESMGLWYDQLLAESLGKASRGALPLTVVNSRDLHSRAQQHQEGKRDKVVNNVIVESWREDALAVGGSDLDQDRLNEISEKTLPEIMTAAIRGTNDAYAEDRRPTTDLLMPRVNEYYLGQFFQMMMLATVLEGRLLGLNPYGQPGVEKYKVNMNRYLGRT